jgi:hypothetical protein
MKMTKSIRDFSREIVETIYGTDASEKEVEAYITCLLLETVKQNKHMSDNDLDNAIIIANEIHSALLEDS